MGTLDLLVAVGEDLGKIDQSFEAIIDRLHGHLKNLEQAFPEDTAMFKGTSNSGSFDNFDLEEYLSSFQWDLMKYRMEASVKDIADSLAAEISQTDQLVKSKMNAFYQAKGEIDAINKSKTGSLLSRDLTASLEGKDLVAGSEFMETLAVIVPRLAKSEWEAGYQSLAELVVPGSSQYIEEDPEYLLYTVTIFKRAKADFIKACSSHKYSTRELKKSDEAAQTRSEADMKALEAGLRSQWSNLFKLVRSNLAEAYMAYMHVKSLRLFVESVLRYGLPAQYLCVYIRFTAGQEKQVPVFKKKLLQALESLRLPGISLVELATAMHSLGLSSSTAATDGPVDQEEQELWAALNMNAKEFDPFVQLTLKIKA